MGRRTRLILVAEDEAGIRNPLASFLQLRGYAAPHPQVVLAFARTLRMLRAACAGVDARAEVLAALEDQLRALLAAAERAGLTPADLARIAAAARLD